jgi:hypothetical protein
MSRIIKFGEYNEGILSTGMILIGGSSLIIILRKILKILNSEMRWGDEVLSYKGDKYSRLNRDIIKRNEIKDEFHKIIRHLIKNPSSLSLNKNGNIYEIYIKKWNKIVKVDISVGEMSMEDFVKNDIIKLKINPEDMQELVDVLKNIKR